MPNTPHFGCSCCRIFLSWYQHHFCCNLILNMAKKPFRFPSSSHCLAASEKKVLFLKQNLGVFLLEYSQLDNYIYKVEEYNKPYTFSLAQNQAWHVEAVVHGAEMMRNKISLQTDFIMFILRSCTSFLCVCATEKRYISSVPHNWWLHTALYVMCFKRNKKQQQPFWISIEKYSCFYLNEEISFQQQKKKTT